MKSVCIAWLAFLNVLYPSVESRSFVEYPFEISFENGDAALSGLITICEYQRVVDAVADTLMLAEVIPLIAIGADHNLIETIVRQICDQADENQDNLLCDSSPPSPILNLNTPVLNFRLIGQPESIIIRYGYNSEELAQFFCFPRSCPVEVYVELESLLRNIMSTGMKSHLHQIKQCGLNPEGILDVGANIGEWTYAASGVFPQAKFHMIEANPKHAPVLQQFGHGYHIALVSDSIENVTYYMLADRHEDFYGVSTGNSMFQENSEFFEDARKEQVLSTTIDTLVSANNLGPFSIIKLDIQGAELPALRGAIKTLQSTEVIIAEMNIMEYNVGAPPFYDLYTFFQEQGFEWYDVMDLHRQKRSTTTSFIQPNILTQMDVMFVKKSSILWSHECTGFSTPSYF